MMTKQKYPKGWDEDKIRALAEHYDNQTDEEAIAELDAAVNAEDRTLMMVPPELVPTIRELIAKHQQDESPDAR
jgi:hypothetical protein